MSRTSTTATPAASAAPPAEKLLTDREVADLLQIDDGTLRNWRGKRKGPAFLRIGSRVRYRPADVHAWLATRTVTTTEVGR